MAHWPIAKRKCDTPREVSLGDSWRLGVRGKPRFRGSVDSHLAPLRDRHTRCWHPSAWQPCQRRCGVGRLVRRETLLLRAAVTEDVEQAAGRLEGESAKDAEIDKAGFQDFNGSNFAKNEAVKRKRRRLPLRLSI